MSSQQNEGRSPAQHARDLEVLATRSAAYLWAASGPNIEDHVKPEYHRRLDRGEAMLIAWRRAIWVCFRRHCQ